MFIDYFSRKSKLRKPVEVALGPQYAGARVSRNDLLNDDDDDEQSDASEYEEARESQDPEDIIDPNTVDLDAEDLDGEIDSDEALGESDDEKFKEFVFRGSGKPKDAKLGGRSKRKTAADFMSASEDEHMEVDEDEDEDVEEFDDDEDMSDGGAQLDRTDESGPDDQEEQSEDDAEEEEEESEEESEDHDSDDAGDDEQARRAELRKMMSEEQKTVVATISQAAKADAEKGNAVKAQRKTFDSLLNVRIRLQKALVATNSIAAAEQKDDEATPYKAAEEAAVKLLNTLNAMRHSLDKTSTSSKKRKHAAIDISTPSADIWATLQGPETQSLPKRQATLEKWSAKVRGTTATPISRKLNQAAEQSITSVLSEQLSGSNAERLVRRTQMPRSCAPAQVKAKITEDAGIFDDADFYQLLLKELVDQRMVDASSAPAGAAGQPVAQWAAVKEAKTKKNVDTKASKGRKMKFTVHEKLQNFMAPEDRGSWEPEAVDRFFGTLLGQRMDLGEEEESDEEAPLAEEALMLFRS